MIGTLSLILIMTKLTAMKALTAKKMQPADPLTEVVVTLRPEDIFRIKATEALTAKKMHPADPLTEDRVILKPEEIFMIKAMETLAAKNMQNANSQTKDRVILKPEDIFRIKSFVQSMNRYDHGAVKDPGSYCRAFDNCYECVKSLWFPCGWCHDFGCTDSPEHLCPFAETKAEQSNITGAIKACPHAEHDGPILVPEGVSTNIRVKLYGPDPAIYDKEIICQIKIGKKLTDLKGVIRSKVVHCYPVVLQSFAKLYGDKDRGALTLIWGGAEPYSNEIPLIVYNCEALASNCEDCAKIQAEYRCGWCDTTSKCMMEEDCDHSRLKWIRDRWTCENNRRVKGGYYRFRREKESN